LPSKFQTHRLDLPPKFAGRRLDQVLAQILSQYSRSRLQRWMEEGAILVEDLGSYNGTVVDGARIKKASLKDGDAVTIGEWSLRLERPKKDEDGAGVAVLKPSDPLESTARAFENGPTMSVELPLKPGAATPGDGVQSAPTPAGNRRSVAPAQTPARKSGAVPRVRGRSHGGCARLRGGLPAAQRLLREGVPGGWAVLRDRSLGDDAGRWRTEPRAAGNRAPSPGPSS
jgi:hypothetical protein